jgi:hypothetical protein
VAPVTLEIFTRSGALVRRYASDDKPEPFDEKEINVPTYWVRPPQTLSSAKGMHRFVWDLRYPAPGAVQRDYPISAIYRDTPREPLGVFAVPGTYTVKLTVSGKTYTQPLTLKMDPRATITPLGLTRQFTLATRIADMMNKSVAAISNLRSPPAPGPKSELIALNSDLATAYDLVEGTDRAPTVQAVKAVTNLERRFNALVQGRR